MLDASAHLWLLVKFLQNYCIKHDKSSANDLLMLSVLSLLSSSRAQFLLFALVSLDLPHTILTLSCTSACQMSAVPAAALFRQ